MFISFLLEHKTKWQRGEKKAKSDHSKNLQYWTKLLAPDQHCKKKKCFASMPLLICAHFLQRFKWGKGDATFALRICVDHTEPEEKKEQQRIVRGCEKQKVCKINGPSQGYESILTHLKVPVSTVRNIIEAKANLSDVDRRKNIYKTYQNLSEWWIKNLDPLPNSNSPVGTK